MSLRSSFFHILFTFFTCMLIWSSWSVRQPVIAPSCVFHFLFVLLLSFLQIGCRFWDLALREHAQYNKVVGHSLHVPPFSLLVLLLLLLLLLPPPPPFLQPHDISPLLRLVFMMNQSAASSEMLTRGSQSVMQQCAYQCCNISCCLCIPGLPTLQTYLWERVKTR